MIVNLFKAIGTVALIVLSIVLTIAILYVSMWLVVGTAIVMLAGFTFSVLQAKDSL